MSNYFFSFLFSAFTNLNIHIFYVLFSVARSSQTNKINDGLFILKQLKNLSDEEIDLQWKQNLYFQYFCGFNEFQIKEPCQFYNYLNII